MGMGDSPLTHPGFNDRWPRLHQRRERERKRFRMIKKKKENLTVKGWNKKEKEMKREIRTENY